MRGRSLKLVLVSISLLLAFVPSASADYGMALDPQGDTAGRLDVDTIIFSHRRLNGQRGVSHLVTTHRSWKPRMLRRPHRVIHLLFDTRDDVGYQRYSMVTERRVEIFFRRGRLRALLLNNLGDPPKKIANVRVRRSGSNGAYVVIPLKLLSKQRLRNYEWAFMTRFAKRGHPRCPLSDPCFDKTGPYQQHDL